MKDHNNISKLIERYVNGDMNAQEQHAFEMQCAQDPFLQDMLDGYQEHSISPNDFEELSQKFESPQKKGFSKRNRWILGFSLVFLLTLILVTSIIIVPNINKEDRRTSESQPKELSQQNTGAQNKESYDTTATTSNISSEQIKIDQQEIHKRQPSDDKKRTITDTVQEITPKEPLTEIPRANIQIPKNQVVNNLIKKKVNIKYYHNFKVMSYDQIRRQNILLVEQEELSGLPASREDDATQSSPQITQNEKVDYNLYLEQTIAFFSKEWYYRCIENCKLILKQYPNDMNASFYGAMSLLNLKAAEEAIPYFKNVINSPYDVFYDESLFYYAIALEKTDPEKSKVIFSTIIQEKGFYAKRAQQELNSLQK